MEPDYSSKPRDEEPKRDYVVEQTLSPEEIVRLFAEGDRLADAVDVGFAPLEWEIDLNMRLGSSSTYVPRPPKTEESLRRAAEVKESLRRRFKSMKPDSKDLRLILRSA